jgi:hypothetical protein
MFSRGWGASLLIAAACWAQPSATVALSNGIRLRISAQSSTGNLDDLKVEMAPATGSSFYRIYRDQTGLAVFAYELKVERSSDGEQFRVSALPAEQDFAAKYPNADGGKPTPTLSAILQSPLLDSGGKFSVDIPTNPGLNMTLTDVVVVQMNLRDETTEAGRQSSAQIRFAALAVRSGGKLLSSGAGTIVAGRYAMFYVPGHGGFFFSTEAVNPRPFLHAGVVDGKKLTFTVDNVEYDCLSEAQILPATTRDQIWVYHDPNYKPGGNWTKIDPSDESHDEFFAAGSDSLSWWLP